MEAWEGVSVVSHSCVTISNCKSKKVEVSWECINIFVTVCSQQALVSLTVQVHERVVGSRSGSKRWEVFPRGLLFSPLFKNQHCQTAIRSGTHEHFRKCSSQVLGLSWVNILHFLQVPYRSTLSPF